VNGRVVFGLLGVYRRPIAKEPSYVFCVSVIVIDRSELEASKTSRLANSSQGKEQTTDGKWYTSGVLTRNEKLSKRFWQKIKNLQKQAVQKTRVHPTRPHRERQVASRFIPSVPQSTDADAAIYFHLRRNEDKGKIDLDNANPALYFHSSRGIRSVRTWMDEKKLAFEATEW
jgi:hypothetical protein